MWKKLVLLSLNVFLLCDGAHHNDPAPGGPGAELTEPEVIDLPSGGSITFTIQKVTPTFTFPKDNMGGMYNLTFSTRLYCYQGRCSMPGPTIKLYPGTTLSLTLENKLIGIGSASHHNGFKDPDVTNLHTHGLHIDPRVDDVLDVTINPICPPNVPQNQTYGCDTKTSHIYNYPILDSHYPGTHWYHPHHHGSVTVQTALGLFGSLLVQPKANTLNVVTMKSTVIFVQWAWLMNQSLCETLYAGLPDTAVTFWPYNDNGMVVPGGFGRGRAPMEFPITSPCGLNKWANPIGQQWSGIQYDVQSPQTFIGWLINGQYKPKITLPTGEWRRLRITMVAVHQLVFKLESVGFYCQAYLLGNDGIFFKNGPRDLSKPPYMGTTFLSPGTRADVAVRCLVAGTYDIWASADDRNGMLKDSMRPLRSEVIAYIVVTGAHMLSKKSDLSGLPMQFPPRPAYLNDLYGQTQQVSTKCYTPNPTEQCNFLFDRASYPIVGEVLDAVNNVEFGAYHGPLLTFKLDEVHEWLVTANFHPYHHHIWPYQINRDIFGGYFAQGGDFRDTVAANGNFLARVHYAGFPSWSTVAHCHYVAHEDNGMIAQLNFTTGTLMAREAKVLPIDYMQKSAVTTCSKGFWGQSYVIDLDINVEIGIDFSISSACELTFNLNYTRQAMDVTRFWFALGFFGNYSSRILGAETMSGNGFVYQTTLQDTSPYAHMHSTVHEVKIDNPSKMPPIIEMPSSFMCTTPMLSGKLLRTTCTRPMSDSWTKFNYAYSHKYIWAYGNGLFGNQTYHAGRGRCTLPLCPPGFVDENNPCGDLCGYLDRFQVQGFNFPVTPSPTMATATPSSAPTMVTGQPSPVPTAAPSGAQSLLIFSHIFVIIFVALQLL